MTFRQFQDHVISRFLIFRSVKYLSFYSFEDLFRSDRIRPRPSYWLTDLDPKNTNTCTVQGVLLKPSIEPWPSARPRPFSSLYFLEFCPREVPHRSRVMVKLGYFHMKMAVHRISHRFWSFCFSDIYLCWIDCRWITSHLNFQKLIWVKILLFNMRLKFSVGSIGLGWSEGGGADGRCWWRWWRRDGAKYLGRGWFHWWKSILEELLEAILNSLFILKP